MIGEGLNNYLKLFDYDQNYILIILSGGGWSLLEHIKNIFSRLSKLFCTICTFNGDVLRGVIPKENKNKRTYRNRK